jgi:hypothetical protein
MWADMKTDSNLRSAMAWTAAWLGICSTRWKAFKFLWQVIWNTDAEPWLFFCQYIHSYTISFVTDREALETVSKPLRVRQMY